MIQPLHQRLKADISHSDALPGLGPVADELVTIIDGAAFTLGIGFVVSFH
jgi:hypothetical protein